jgi:hypothetical protein
MLIVSGIYRFRPKRTAFRNDYCLSCQSPRRSLQFRTFDVFHLYWIPLIPLGFRKRWICTVCQKEPRVSYKTRRSFKWAGLAILLLVTTASWIVPLQPDSATGEWVVRITMPLSAILLLIHLLRTPKDPSLAQLLATVTPASDTSCPFCGTALLLLTSQSSCPTCGILRL